MCILQYNLQKSENNEKQSRVISQSNLEKNQKDDSIRKEMLMTKTKEHCAKSDQGTGLQTHIFTFTNSVILQTFGK